MSGLSPVNVRCPDCDSIGMWRRVGRYGKYLACQISDCPGRRNVTDDWTPLDRVEDSATRRARIQAHDAFDPLWQHAERLYDDTMSEKKARRIARGRAYHWLADQLGLTVPETHMEQFDKETCEKVVVICAGMTDAAIRDWKHEQKVAAAPTKELEP